MKDAVQFIKIAGKKIFKEDVLAYGYERNRLSDLVLYLSDGTIQKVPAAKLDETLTMIDDRRFADRVERRRS